MSTRKHRKIIKMLLQVPLEGEIEERFKDLFESSGYKSQSEFVRFLINQEYKHYPKCCPNTKEMEV